MTVRRILIVTDAWLPQVNGVVRTLQATVAELLKRGHQVEVITPAGFRSIPCPTYPEIRLSFVGPRRIGRIVDAFAPDYVHISTEGPLGLAARRCCIKRGIRFSTAYHTQFPDYLAARIGLPAALFWTYIRWFHKRSARILVATDSIRAELHRHGLVNIAAWSRGVDLSLFRPMAGCPKVLADHPRPIMLYVGRVAVEKNIAAFLGINAPGTKVVVGDGPQLGQLKLQFPDALFLGNRSGQDLAALYAAADVCVFPSKTDTFGLVQIEAMACGTPVAAYPVPGPLDVVGVDGAGGVLNDNLSEAIRGALALDRSAVATAGQRFSWAAATDQFLAALVHSDQRSAVTKLRSTA